VEFLAQVALPLQGQYLNSLLGTFRGTTNAWFAAAGILQFGIFGALMLIAIACRIGVIGARAQSASAIPWQFPKILEHMILPLIVINVSSALLGHALGIGEGIGTTVTGLEFVGASGLFGTFMDLIVAILILPFGPSITTGLPGAIALAVAAVIPAAPLWIAVGLFIFGLTVGLRLLKVAEDCTLCVLRCQIDTLIIMPFALILCAFVPIPGDTLWRGAIQVFFRSIFRLGIALAVASLAIIALQRIVATIATIGKAPNVYVMLGEIFACVGGAVIVGSLVEGSTVTIDAAFAAVVGWGQAMPTATEIAQQAVAALRKAA
jgi:hypothetical protein